MHQQKQLTPLPSDHKVDKMLTLIVSYLKNTHYNQYLRNSHSHYKYLSPSNLKNLFSSGEIFRVKQDMTTMILSFNQPSICVLIYGQMSVENRLYQKGDFMSHEQDKVEMCFTKKTTLVMLNRDDVEQKLFGFQRFYFKKEMLERMMPLDLLKLGRKQISGLVEGTELREGEMNRQILNNVHAQRGIYVLYEGNYCIQTKQGVKFSEITNDYFGEQIIWQDQYQNLLVPQSFDYKYIFIPLGKLMQILTQQNIKIIRDIYNRKMMLRRQQERDITVNLEYTRFFINKMKLTQKQSVKCCQFQTPFKQNPRKNYHLPWKMQKNAQGKLTLISFNPKTNHHYEPLPNSFVEEQMRNLIKANPEEMTSKSGFQKREKEFKPKLYGDMRATSQKLFRRRVRTESKEYNKINEAVNDRVVTVGNEKIIDELNNLPKTLSVLLRYYESTQKLKNKRSRTLPKQQGFLGSAKERRLNTTLKLHKDIFMRQYFQVKAMEERAFKTWR